MAEAKTSTIGRRLTELRRSHASGKHDPRPRRQRDRSAARRAAIKEAS